MTNDILAFFVGYFKKLYNSYVANNESIYTKKGIDELIYEQKLYVLETCLFHNKEYYLLTQRDIKNIFKNSLTPNITLQDIWKELRQYSDLYSLYGPKQRRLQNCKVNRARGILLAPDFLIDAMNDNINYDIFHGEWICARMLSRVLNYFINDNVSDIARFVQRKNIPFIEYLHDDMYFIATGPVKKQFNDQERPRFTNKALCSELSSISSTNDKYIFKEKRHRINGRHMRGVILNEELLSDIIDKLRENIQETDIQEIDKEPREANLSYRIFKQDVLKRDNHQCQCCGLTKKLHVHHIFPYKAHSSLRTNIDNGITLCQYCHQKYHTVYGKTINVNPVTFANFMRRFGTR